MPFLAQQPPAIVLAQQDGYQAPGFAIVTGRPPQIQATSPAQGTEPSKQALPESMKQAIPAKPSWVLVIPYEMTDDGHPIWGQQSAWARAWLAPAKANGTQFIAISGDADDHDRMPDTSLQSPPDAAASVARLRAKYGAPAVALVELHRDDTIQAWLWRDGGMSSSDLVMASNASDARTQAIAALDQMLAENAPENRPGQASEAVDGTPENQDSPEGQGGPHLRLGTSSAAPAGLFAFVLSGPGVESLLGAIANTPGVAGATLDPSSQEIRGWWRGTREGFTAALRQAGIPVSD